MRIKALPAILFVFLCLTNSMHAAMPLPLPNGADAPNFTLTDLDGVTHTLYDYLDAGKTVMIDFSATWCGPCWNYHNTHILADLYNDYGPNGTDEVMVFFIEADASTPVSSLYGGAGSMGNWVAGTPYPIMDDTGGVVSNSFQITYYPTLYAICPNRKTYVVGQVPLTGWVNWINSCSLDATALVEDASCYGLNDGSVNQSTSGGIGNLTYQWSNGAYTQDVSNLAPGTYTCTITEGQGHKIQAGPYTIVSPPQLVIASSTVANAGCFGEATGSINVQAGGGSPGYSYLWNNGAPGATLANVPAGNYSVLITDNNGCTKVTPFVVQQPSPLVSSAIVNNENCGGADGTIILQPQGGTYPYTYDFGNGPTGSPIANNLEAGTYPVSIEDINGCSFNLNVIVSEDPPPYADAGPDAQVDCLNTEVSLDGTASDAGTGITYQWTTSNGLILSGANTTQPIVGAPGTYELQVIDQIAGCVGTSTVVVSENMVLPVSDAGTNGLIDCNQMTVNLDGSGSSQGSNYAYQWQTNDGNIISGADELIATADAVGTYVLEVTNLTNGCSSSSTVVINENQNEPVADAGPSGEINCVVSTLTLDGSASESGANISYFWSTANGNIVSGADSPTPLVDAAGLYQIEVLDILTGCSATAEVQVDENMLAPVAAVVPEGILNCNNPDLDLDATASESGANIAYSWSTSNGNIVSGGNSATPTVDAPGIYVLEVLNTQNGCLSTAEVVVSEILPIEAEIQTQTDLLCFGESTGSATVIADLGTLPYTYSWSSGGDEATETNLAAGVYSVSVSDGDNCMAIVEVEISGPQQLLSNAVATNESYSDANDGTASASPTGGTGPYTYSWSNGESSASITGLEPGNYTVVVTDANGCTRTQMVAVGEFSCTISAQAIENPVSCFGGSDGVAQLDLSNAADPIQILWSTGGTEAIETGLAAGTYTVEVLDGNNCPTTTSVTITEPSSVLLEVQNSQDVSCFGASDGSATVSGSGGVGDYVFVWPGGNTDPAQDNLAAGTYLVSVTDANGCETELPVMIDQPDALQATAQLSGESSNGSNDAVIELMPTGGTAPYMVVWNTGASGTTISDLAPGTYSVEIMDAQGCSYAESYTIDPFDCGFIQVSSLSEGTSCFDGNDGVAMVDISGGTGPFSYQWFDGSTGSSVSDLPAGEYTVSILDANNCPVEGTVLIEQPEALELQVTDQTDIECPGQVSGSAVVAGSGGTPGYQYLWSNSQTGPMAVNLPPGMIQVKVTDANGCEEIISVEIVEGTDDTPPTVLALDMITINLNNSGLATLTSAMVDLGSFDNCGTPNLSLNNTVFGCSELGVQEILYTAVDNSGNSTTTTILVEVVDAILPSITCPQNIVSSFCNEPIFFEPFATDNCDVDVNLVAGMPSGSVFPQGMTEMIFEAVDPSGNSKSCSFTVTIENTLTAAVETTGTCQGAQEGTAFAEASGGLPGYTYTWDTGDTGPSLSGLPVGEYELLVTDAAGCVSTLTATVPEFQLPEYTVVEVQQEENSNGNGAIDVSVSAGTAPYLFLWTDGEGNPVGDNEDLTGLSSGIYFLEITDANGCSVLSEPFIIENQVGTSWLLSNNSMNLFPNPAKDEFEVKLVLPEARDAQLQLFDLTGRMIRLEDSKTAGQHHWRIGVEDLPSGIYLVRIQVEGQSISKKLIVE
ncbi:MAG: T9SS type A sorting domain-containing protein [Saprospiraceae bacterium]|nr:T9SS type A sorting domain-containing protein [Saprospiraceae bacterium]